MTAGAVGCSAWLGVAVFGICSWILWRDNGLHRRICSRWFWWAVGLCDGGLALCLGILVGVTLGNLREPPAESDADKSHDAANPSGQVGSLHLLRGESPLPFVIGEQLVGTVVRLFKLPFREFLVGHSGKFSAVHIRELAFHYYFVRQMTHGIVRTHGAVATPNDLKLSEREARRGLCPVGGEAVGA